MSDKSSQATLFTEKQTEKPQGPVECLGLTFENDEARRAHFLEKLREKLKDPEFRKIEGFPIGEDEDILALSDPPYYTACPNPFLEDFIKHYGKPYDPKTDNYRREPFAADVSEGKNDPVYNAHAYHTKVSPLAVAQYIQHYTKPGDLIVDFFSGTCMSGVACQSHCDGTRHALLCDLSVVATHVGGAFMACAPLSDVQGEAREVLAKVREEYDWMYETRHCGWPASEREITRRHNTKISRNLVYGVINFIVWSDVFICGECGSDVVYWNSAIDFHKYSVRDSFGCPSCGVSLSKKNMQRAISIWFDSDLGEPIRSVKQKPVLINYTVGKKRYEKIPDQEDEALINRILSTGITHWFPTDSIPKGDKTAELIRIGISRVHHFYTRRNLIALSALREKVTNNRALMFWFTATLPWCGRENRLHLSNYFGRTGGQITSLRGAWYVPSLSVETNVLERFKLRIESALISNEVKSRSSLVTTQSATSLSNIPEASVDYIFVDPPFGENIMYSELNVMWDAWLKVRTNNQKEAIVNRSQKKGLLEYTVLLTKAFAEGYRVLKPGRWITVEFHNSKNSVWNSIQEALQRAGFIVADVRTLDKGKGSFNQVTAAGAVKQDLIISAYKPNGGLEERFKLEAGTEEGVWDFVRTHLRQLPVFVSKGGRAEMIAERQNYLLFDRMVAFHVQRGVTVPISASEFYAGLEQRFAQRDGMYFLPEQAAEYDKKRMSVKDLLQLELFVTEESSAIQWLRQQLTKKPQTAGELKPQFMQETKGWQKNEKMLELDELLAQNFLMYDGKGEVPSQIHSYLSTNFKELRNLAKDAAALQAKAKNRWYVPDPKKSGDLEKLRERALLKEFEEYRQSKQRRLKVFRLEAVRAGFKKAWEGRDYRTIIAVAQKIPENVLHEDAKLLMWYDHALTRTGG
ncbi:MAG: hypothetical protein DKINENOH_01699 [bacterium]|nr:hypothetical protein [bacterium]